MFSIQTAANTFLANLSLLEQRINKTNRQVSSGLRVQTVSDAPDSVSQILQVNAAIARNNQIKSNLGQVQTEVNAAEGAINMATTLMDRAAQIAAEGSNGTNSNRAALADQVRDLLTEMQQLASTQVGGRYVFSGDSDQTAPYNPVDFAANPANGVGSYQGTASNREVEDPYGFNFSIAYTAQDIFDPSGSTASTSVFKSLTDLYTALSNNDQAAVTASTANITSAASYLSGMQAKYGDIQNKVIDSLNSQAILDTNLHAQLSSLQDADEGQAITEQQTESTALQAAETAYSAMPKKSLFDYLG